MTIQREAAVSQLDLTGRSFLTIHDFTPAEVVALLDLAADLKAKQKNRDSLPAAGRPRRRHDLHEDQHAHAHELRGRHRAARRPADLPQRQRHPAARRRDHQGHRQRDEPLRRLHHDPHLRPEGRGGPRRATARSPSINGLTDDHHPCQGMADALTIREHCGRLEGVKLVYIGDGNNVTHSLAEVGAKTGMHVVACTPDDYRPDADIIARAQEDAKQTGATVELTERRRGGGARAPTSSTPTPSRAWARRRSTTSAWRRSRTTRSTRRLLERGRSAGQGHALPAGALGRGDHRRGAVLAALRGLRPGGEPAARAEGDHGGGHRAERDQIGPSSGRLTDRRASPLPTAPLGRAPAGLLLQKRNHDNAIRRQTTMRCDPAPW